MMLFNRLLFTIYFDSLELITSIRALAKILAVDLGSLYILYLSSEFLDIKASVEIFMMESAYKNLSIFFIIMLSFIVLGFFRTYFSLFPTFNGITTIQNFHGITLLCWFAMLIIQPMLIRYGKYKWHRILGKASYILMPLVLISLYLTVRGGYIRHTKELPDEIDSLTGALALDFGNIIAIALFYILAIRKNL